MTKTEIKAALDLAGVTYAKKANLETLQALHATMLEATDPKRTPEGNVDLSKPELEPAPPATPEPVAPEAPVAPATGTGLKIEKDREERNGIKRPSIGGKCRAIWDALDAHAESTGDDPTAKDVKQLAADNGWNPNNASIEYYQWRKFQGIAKKG